MTKLNSKVDAFVSNSTSWKDETEAMRHILLDCGLTEDLKWGKPCYTYQGSNTVIIFGMKDYCGLGFFKGAIMDDPKGILTRQGENSQAMRLIRFTSVQDIARMEAIAKAYIQNAIEIEKAGLKIDFKEKHELVFPPELQQRMDDDAAFKAAFNALTPGRQRGYNLHFSAAKHSKTREARIQKYLPKILQGKGMTDR